MKHWKSSLVIALGFASVPGLASANGGVQEPDPLISGGVQVETCGWPSVVAVQGGGLCTGTLVAPNVVAYAAHCGGGSSKKIRFSEDSFSGKSVTPEFCMTNPGYTFQGNDWAFCKLAQDIDVPVTPVVFGCETDILQPGTQIAIIGFGANTDVGGAGFKRWGMTSLLGVNWGNNTTQIGNNGQPSICPGDSGGPTMVQYPDGSWHSFGIASTYNGTCGSTGIHALLPGAVEWIEENSGVDITPCHDADGSWNPTPMCQSFYTGDETGTGTWNDWCEGTPAGGSSATCGDPFDAVPDADAPGVEITFPANLQEFEVGEAINVTVDANDAGWGVKVVALKIDGALQPIQDEDSPYAFNNVEFPAGTWELIAVGEDWAGNIGESAPVNIGVGMPAEEDPGPGTESGTDGSEEDGSDDGDDGAEEEGGTGAASDDGMMANDSGDEKGCACDSGATPGAPWWMLVALIGLRRRKGS